MSGNLPNFIKWNFKVEYRENIWINILRDMPKGY